MQNVTGQLVRVLRIIVLAIFVVSAALLLSQALRQLTQGSGTRGGLALGVSMAVGALACFAMLSDGADLWIRGRRMATDSVRALRPVIFLMSMSAIMVCFFVNDFKLALMLGPALILYYVFVVRTSPVRAPPPAPGSAGRQAASRSRQRKGGKKH